VTHTFQESAVRDIVRPEVRTAALAAAARLFAGANVHNGTFRDLEQITVAAADRYAEWITNGDYDWTAEDPAPSLSGWDTWGPFVAASATLARIRALEPDLHQRVDGACPPDCPGCAIRDALRPDTI
jgi:hypothetical protein